MTFIKNILKSLKNAYPEPFCALESASAFELLVCARLSAQCTDARVNEVSKKLFAAYPDPQSMAMAELGDVESLIRSCGLYRVKARNIIDMSKILCEKYGGCVPGNQEALLGLPGVGRKIANLILGDIFGKPAIVADTHCIRISNRLGLCDTKDPYKVELALDSLIPKNEQADFCHRLVLHGRAVCRARRPLCGECILRNFCAGAVIVKQL